ncbi:sigma factor [Mesorhizobium sp. IMUNJ 23232]|uniref:sigma factor n=1 Tax=Mesorhizobium sp. IMUNJ 23232 TaxID=3376064 RepID=UPI0037B6E71C
MLDLSSSALASAKHEAELVAARLVRRMRLPPHEKEDIAQDLLVDFIARLKHFKPDRGSPGAFAGTTMKHCAARLANRIARHRALFGHSLDDAIGAEGRLGDLLSEDDSYSAWMGQPADQPASVEVRLGLERALSRLTPAQLNICARLTDITPSDIIRKGLVSRAGLYRQLSQIRLEFAIAGIATAD